MDKQNKEQLEHLRHSAAHLLAAAVMELWPKAKRTIGPAIETGFYYDFDFGDEKISETDLPKIETKMHELVESWKLFSKEELSSEAAKAEYKGNEYKLELISDLIKEGEKTLSFYRSGNYRDLCKGGHIKDPSQELRHFKLLSIAGAYWRGDEKNKMLTRIYGTAFFSEQELKDYLWQIEEAKKRDHRLLAKQLDLYMLDDEVGQGLPIWLPKGAFIRHKVMEFAFNTYLNSGYQPVVGPHISSEALWSHSGHLGFYKENMYNSFGIENEQYRLKPMNCPIHVKIFKRKPHSYRELPIRYTEMGTVYRYEKSGVLHGLTRVRGFTQDDAHIICTEDQLHNELVKALKLTLFILNTFGFKEFEMNVSVRDPDNKQKYAGSDEGWSMAEKTLIKALQAIDYNDYVYDVGGAVFYGPKIDLKVKDSIGRQWQLSTIQIDFNLPGRFKMTYLDKDGQEKIPFMIHRALLGSLERFMGVYIEHTGGAFPVWLSPVQVGIIPISDKYHDGAKKFEAQLAQAGVRVELDAESKPLGAKIRSFTLQKVPYLCIIGEKEITKSVGHDLFASVRTRDGKDLGMMSLSDFKKVILDEIDKKR